MAGRNVTAGGLEIKQCTHPGKHTLHPYGDLGKDEEGADQITQYHCPGVGAVMKCSACGTVNLTDAISCNECSLSLDR